MKYKSELIKEIVESRGHEKSSVHYESECVESWIEEAKGSYPKLCDYQSEWLNYINENPLGEFPYETVSNVTDATVNNVVPYAYKSATLKGSTKYRDIETGDILDTFDETKNLELVSVKMPVLTTTGKNLFNPKWLKNTESESVLRFEDDGSVTLNGPLNLLTWFYLDLPKGTYQASSFNDTLNAFHVFWTGTDGYFESRNYFTLNEDTHIKGYISKGNYDNYNIKLQLETGTQKTSYEPFKSNILTVNEDVTLRSNGSVCDELDLLTGKLTQRIDEDGEILTLEVVKTVELTVIDQDGNTLSRIKPIEGTMHLSTSGTPIKPLFNGEIPVEATSQNLASFIGV